MTDFGVLANQLVNLKPERTDSNKLELKQDTNSNSNGIHLKNEKNSVNTNSSRLKVISVQSLHPDVEKKDIEVKEKQLLYPVPIEKLKQPVSKPIEPQKPSGNLNGLGSTLLVQKSTRVLPDLNKIVTVSGSQSNPSVPEMASSSTSRNEKSRRRKSALVPKKDISYEIEPDVDPLTQTKSITLRKLLALPNPNRKQMEKNAFMRACVNYALRELGFPEIKFDNSPVNSQWIAVKMKQAMKKNQ